MSAVIQPISFGVFIKPESLADFLVTARGFRYDGRCESAVLTEACCGS